MHICLERLARNRFQLGEYPNLTYFQLQEEAFQNVWLARTTCGTCCKTIPLGIFLRRVPLLRCAPVEALDRGVT